MTYYNYKARTLRHRQINRHYRQLVLFLCGVITLLIVLLFMSQRSPAQADEMVIKTYQSKMIEPGDCLWSLAEEYRLPEMSVEEYMAEIRRVNQLSSNELVSGEYLILPIFTYEMPIPDLSTSFN